MSDRIWKHTLTPGLVVILTKIGEAVARKHKNKVHIPRDLDLSDLSDNLKFSLHGNYSKLRFFGLIHYYKNDMGTHEAGYWLLTRRGAMFLRNNFAVHSWVKTLDNSIVERSPDRVIISTIWKDYNQELWQSFWLGESPGKKPQHQLSFI